MLDCLDAPQLPATDRHIAQPMHAPQFWHMRLLGAGAAQRRAPARLLGDAARLVVAAPHPDDEVLMCAGLMQAALAQGLELLLVAVTDGEACFGPGAGRARVASLRRAESRAGMAVLGAARAPVQRLGLPDGALGAHEAQLGRTLGALLRPGDLLVAPWRLDGHPDHDATGRAAAAACARRACRLLEAPVWMWHWATPRHPAVGWERLAISPLPPRARACKARALACHASQLAPHPGHGAVVDDALRQRAQWPFESFFLP